MKAPVEGSSDHKDLDQNFLNSLIIRDEVQKFALLRRKALKLISLLFDMLRPLSSNSARSFQPQKPSRCVLTVPHLSLNDAVCNDVFSMRESLRKNGLESSIYAQTYDKGLAHEVIRERVLENELASPSTLLIYTHCVFWPKGKEVLSRAQGAIWFRYHNVTPAEFFAPYDPISAYATQKGREQTFELIKSFDSKITRYLPVSNYNAEELKALGADISKFSVLAPFHKLDTFAQCEVNKELYSQLKDGKLNILFVGRVVPNKAFDKLLETLHSYIQNHGTQVRLIFAGALTENFRTYYKELFSFINRHRLSSFVHWTGKLSLNDLHSYYKSADIFLLLSEHEGFCLPILEAQFHKVPIIAVGKTAIRDTMGEGQICFEEYNSELLAKALHRISQDKILQKDLIEAGLSNLKKYDSETIRKQLLSMVEV